MSTSKPAASTPEASGSTSGTVAIVAPTPTASVSASVLAEVDPATLPTQLCAVYRTNVVSFFRGPFNTADYKADRVALEIANPTSKVAFSNDGARLAVATTSGVRVVDAETLEDVATLPCAGAAIVGFSPLGHFVTTFEMLTAECPKNFAIWKLPGAPADDAEAAAATEAAEATEPATDDAAAAETAAASEDDANDIKPVLRLVLEKDNRIHSELQWTADEKHLLFHPSGASEIHIYNGRAPAKVVSKITVHRLRSYKVSPLGKDGVTSHIAVFSLAKGNQEPAAVHVFDLAKPARARTMLPFGGAEEATLMWNSLGSAVLIKTLTHDTGGASYYGQTRLYMLLADGSAEYNVTLGTGAVLDVAWAPRTYDFITLIGEARCAKATVWSAKNCQPTKELGTGAWNTIRFSPSGRFVVLAGFGALAGEFEVWDRNKMLRLCSSQDTDSPKTLEWTPCGRYFITATLFPWLRVGNKFKIRHYGGGVVYEEAVATEDLQQIAIRPALPNVFPDRPASPELVERISGGSAGAAVAASATAGAANGANVGAGAGAGASAAAKKAAPPAPAPKAGGYVPPHKRGLANAGATDLMKQSQNAGATGPRDLLKEKKKLITEQILPSDNTNYYNQGNYKAGSNGNTNGNKQHGGQRK